MNKVINRGDIKLMGKTPRDTGKPQFINANVQMNGTDKPCPTGPATVYIGANGEMQKL